MYMSEILHVRCIRWCGNNACLEGKGKATDNSVGFGQLGIATVQYRPFDSRLIGIRRWTDWKSNFVKEKFGLT